MLLTSLRSAASVRAAILSWLLVGLFVSMSSSTSWADEAQAVCATPRSAVVSFVDNLMEDGKPAQATACFDFSAGPKAAPDQLRVARDLLAVLDGEGKFVDYSSLPHVSDYRDELTGAHRYVLFPSLSEIYLEKVSGQWLVSSHTVSVADELFHRTYRVPLQRIAQRLPKPFKATIVGVALWKWLALAILILFAPLVAKLSELILRSLLRRGIARFVARWDEGSERIVLRRLNLLIAAGVVAALLPNIGLPVRFNQVLFVVVKLVSSLAGVMILHGFVDLVFNAWARLAQGTDTKMDDQLLPLLRRATKALVLVVGLLFVLQNLDVDIGSLLAGLGIGGLAFALAAKDTLANLFGSLTVFADRPFQIGDWVQIGSVEGTVEEVGFRSTRVRTFYDSVVTIPNSKMTDTIVDNMGRRRYRRFKTVIGLTYDTTPEQMQAFVEGVRASILASPHTRKDAFEVHMQGLGSSSLDILVYAFFDVPGWREELVGRHNLLMEWMRLADSLGVEFAFPTQTLHVDSLATQQAQAAHAAPAVASLKGAAESFGPGGSEARPGGPVVTDGFWPVEPGAGKPPATS